jgi:4-amino-4-deoxy-L-arabinose transferase-like glycosyltransferase
MSFSQTTSSAQALRASRAPGLGATTRSLTGRLRRPELALLVGIAAVLNLWALSRNGWANDYYSAAVRSMSSSWHDFLYASLDSSGVMTVDKPPLSLWVQALSARAFGYHPLSVLVPQALMGVASVALLYDLVRRPFGRLAGFVAGLVLATTPIMVAVSRHNNPDALLVLCSVAALWFTVRALEPEARHRLRKLVLAGVCVGLGFETKMGVALVVVPGIVAAWLLVAPSTRTTERAGMAEGARWRRHVRGRLRAAQELLCAGAAMVLVAGAWPALVELTPAADRPWVSGTSDNHITSLIFGYNGLGRVDGQTGGPGGAGPGGGTMFGGAPEPLRLLNSALGGQAGWLLGFAIVGAVAVLASSRLRRRDPRSGWLVAVGGAFLTTAALFSAASGIFHPYYVSLLAPFAAALVGAGVAELRTLTRARASAHAGGNADLARVLAPIAVAAGVVVELVVRSRYPGQLPWLPPVLVAVAAPAALVLGLSRSPRARTVALLAATGALLLAPAAWSLDTLGYAASGTFPAGGPQSAELGGAPFAGGRGARAAFARGANGAPSATFPGAGGGGSGAGSGGGRVPPARAGGPPAGTPPTGLPGGGLGGGFGPARAPGGPGALGGPGGAGGPFGSDSSLTSELSYVNAHGGGTIAVSSQSSAAAAILQKGAAVAGIGGFSGRESDVSVSWLAQEVRAGKIRWVLVESRSGFGALRGDNRAGSRTAMSAAANACVRVAAASSTQRSATRAQGGFANGTAALYDCRGHARALAATASA